MSKKNDILNLNMVELRQRTIELKKRLVEMRFDKATGRLLDSSLPAKVKKELARILTRQSQLSAE
ncbi:MAG TPA: 50S ribosomal protein L29 [Myxococcota bacterium]|nr:50S ribosomal protein L29 [Myxococcota bacterium]